MKRSNVWVTVVLRLILGIVFLYASFDKILHPEAFAQAVYNYQILPYSTINLVALTLPWLELILGLCLISGFWLPGATAISTGLLTVFIVAMAYNEIRGLDVHCGCFSTENTEGAAGFSTLIRDILFLFVSAYLTFHVFLSQQVALKVSKR
jgi:uncharacterized membrane protein YphA (DoxX/SURF4 family)